MHIHIAENADEPGRASSLGPLLCMATALVAASLFSLLVGAGRLLFLQPDRTPLLTWACIATGLVLLPAWLRMARADGARPTPPERFVEEPPARSS